MNRKIRNTFLKGTASFAVMLCFGLLFFLFGVIIWKGIGAMSFGFITDSSRNFGKEGGVFYQIAGSVMLVLMAAVLSFPVGIGTAIFKSEYLKSPRWQKISDILIFSVNGIPSVIFGIFGLIFFVNLMGTGISWFVGSIILGMMILPTITLSAYQSINSIPAIYRESGLALGLNKWQVITKVLLPQGFSGAVTGLLIGLARAVGETAPIMFIATAFSGVAFPRSLQDPVLTLPTHILALAQEATDPQALQNAWGASFLLICLVMVFSVSALIIRIQHQKLSH